MKRILLSVFLLFSTAGFTWDITGATNVSATNATVISDATMGGNVGLAVDKKITMPADSSGSGPFLQNIRLGEDYEGNFTFSNTNYCWQVSTPFYLPTAGLFALDMPPSELLGGTVVIDQITVYGHGEDSTIAQFDLVQTNRNGGYSSIATNGIEIIAAGNYSLNLLSSDKSRATYPNQWYLDLSVNGDNVTFKIYDVVIQYHLE